jgi:hypothetical protein
MKNFKDNLYHWNPKNALWRIGFGLVWLLALGVATACDNFVEVDLPNSQLTGQAVFEDMATADAAMAGLYAKMRNNGTLTGNSTGISVSMGLYADEFDFYQAGATSNFHSNTLVAADSGVADTWSQSYNQIYMANAIIEGVGNSLSLPQANRGQLRGEALFVRALLHFYLLNSFGDIPYITTTDYNVNSNVSRMPQETVYDLVTADLEEAVSLLPEDYITPERVRANRSAAMAVLARVYLYRGQWAEAANAASAVINSPLYTWETDLDKVFLKESTTTIWQFMPDAPGSNTLEGGIYVFTSGPPPIVGLKPSFVTSFETGDQRREHWVKAVTEGTSTWYHANKYKQQGVTGSSVEYSIVLRLAEQYLIRAEARARQGELTAAKEDLDIIRNTAGLPGTVAVTPDEIISDIMAQRRFELFTEFGHRFLDLKRTGLLDAALPPTKPGWDTHDRLWPVPASELILNPNLAPQNPGY